MRSIYYMFLGLIALPFLLVRFGPKFFTNLFHDPFQGITGEIANQSVLLDSGKSHVKTTDTLVKQVHDMVQIADWRGISELIKKAVASKRDAAPLQREYTEIVYAARIELQDILMSLDPKMCTVKIAGLLDAYDAGADTLPDDPGLAALAARAHLDVGWAWRGDGFTNEVSQNGWEEMARHYRLAADRIAPFLNADILHPCIAHAAHIIARQNDDNGHELRRIYEAWRQSDPGNPLIYEEHGFHLLPRWFGTYDELAREAQRAAAAVADTLGAAPYFWMYQSVFNCEELALSAVDPDLFVDAVCDHLRLAGTSFEANRVLRKLSETWLYRPIDQQLDDAESTVRDMARAACRAIVETQLFQIDSAAWSGQINQAKQTIALLYKDEIDDGYILDFSNGHFEKRGIAA